MNFKKLTVEPDFWSSDNAHEVNREISTLPVKTDKIQSSQNELLELETMAELLGEVDDPELNSEFYTRSAAPGKKH